MAEAIIENSPKELVVDPIGKKDVEELIKEALKGFTPSQPSDDELEVYSFERDDVNGNDPHAYTKGEIVEMFKKIQQGKLVILDDTLDAAVNFLTFGGVLVACGVYNDIEENTTYATIIDSGENDEFFFSIKLTLDQDEEDETLWHLHITEL